MKKIISVLTAVVLLLSAMAMTVSANAGLKYTAKYGTPKIDGAADDLWSSVEWTQVALPNSTSDKPEGTSRVKMLHDDKYIYYLVEINDPSINGDVFEFYVDEDSCKKAITAKGYECDKLTHLLIKVADGVFGDYESWSVGRVADTIVESAMTVNGNVRVIEWAFKPIGGIPAGESTMAIEFLYTDNNAAGKNIANTRWNVNTLTGDVSAHKDLSAYGILTLEAKKAETKPAAANTNPKTGDAGVVSAALLAIVAAAAVVATKKNYLAR